MNKKTKTNQKQSVEINKNRTEAACQAGGAEGQDELWDVMFLACGSE